MYIVKNGNITKYMWHNGRIYKDNEAVYKNVRENFTLTLGDNGEVYIFSQDNEGNIFLNGKEILHNVSDKIYDVCFEALFQGNKAELFYKINGTVMMQTMEEGKWSRAISIDKVYSDFRLFKIGERRVLFYRKKGFENQIGYRIIDGIIGEYNVLYKTSFSIGDSCAIFFDDTFHCVFIVKNMFSSSLIYKGDMGVMRLYDGAGISKCCIFGRKERVYVIWEVNGKLFCTIGENGHFSGRIKIGSGEFEKARVVGNDDNKMCISELFVDKTDNFRVIDVDKVLGVL